MKYFVCRPSVVMWSAGNEPRSYRSENVLKPIIFLNISKYSEYFEAVHLSKKIDNKEFEEQEPKRILLCKGGRPHAESRFNSTSEQFVEVALHCVQQPK